MESDHESDPLHMIRATFDPNDMKVAVCEYLLQVNRDHDPDGKGHAFIPPTAIDWLGNGIVDAILASVL